MPGMPKMSRTPACSSTSTIASATRRSATGARLPSGPAAIDDLDAPGDGCSGVRAEEADVSGDLDRLQEPAERHRLEHHPADDILGGDAQGCRLPGNLALDERRAGI